MGYSGNGNGSSSIQGATDVFLSNTSTGQVLAYDAGTLKWVNRMPSGSGATTIAQVSGLQAALDSKTTIVIDPSSTNGLPDGTLIAYTS